MHNTTIFIIQLCVVVELFSLKDAYGFIAETASFYVTVESGVSMRKVNVMVKTVNICMAIRTLSETDDSGNIPCHCVADGSDGVGENECKHPETKLCKRVGSMWASWRLQESTWVNALLRDRELECPDDKFSVVLLLFTENLPDRIRFREATAIITLGNALGLSDTVPGAFLS